MDEYLPSLITLSGFVVPALLLLLLTRPLTPATLAYLMVIAALCLMGGFLFAAGTITVLELKATPVANSLLVLAGAVLSLMLRQAMKAREKTE